MRKSKSVKKISEPSPSEPSPNSRKSQPAAVTLCKVSKGKRAKFFNEEALDQLFAIVTALTAELSVAFDRIDSLERVLSAAGVRVDERLKSYRPDAAATELRKTAREQLIERVFAVFDTYETARSR